MSKNLKQFHIVWQIGHDGNGPLLTGRTFEAESSLEALAAFHNYIEKRERLLLQQKHREELAEIDESCANRAELTAALESVHKRHHSEFEALDETLVKLDPLYVYNLDLGILPIYQSKA